MTGLRAIVALVIIAGAACGFLRRDGGEAEPVRVELNSAPLRVLETLPGVTPSMARRIVEGRPYGDPDDLVERDILTDRELERLEDWVFVAPLSGDTRGEGSRGR
jgi:competence protein ComEA